MRADLTLPGSRIVTPGDAAVRNQSTVYWKRSTAAATAPLVLALIGRFIVCRYRHSGNSRTGSAFSGMGLCEETTMRVDPEELVELKNHGPMKLRCAVARAMLLLPKERREAAILRQSEPSVLKFKMIKDLSTVLERSRRRKPRKSSAKRSPSRVSKFHARKTSSRRRVA